MKSYNDDTRDITKSNLEIKDVKQQAKADDTLGSEEMNVTESRMHGTRRSSYQECGPVRIIVRHQGDVDDEVRGARSRHIDSIFLETHLGERFLCPSNSLHIARALAQHLSRGGEMHDDMGGKILLIGEEMDAMRHFVREVKRRQFEDAETLDIADGLRIDSSHDPRKASRHLCQARCPHRPEPAEGPAAGDHRAARCRAGARSCGC